MAVGMQEGLKAESSWKSWPRELSRPRLLYADGAGWQWRRLGRKWCRLVAVTSHSIIH